MAGRAAPHLQNAHENTLAAIGTAAVAQNNIDRKGAQNKGENEEGKLKRAVRADRDKAPYREDNSRYGQFFRQLPALNKRISVYFHILSLSTFHFFGTVKTPSLP